LLDVFKTKEELAAQKEANEEENEDFEKEFAIMTRMKKEQEQDRLKKKA